MSPTPDSDTPRTDAALALTDVRFRYYDSKLVDCCRRLERELGAAERAIKTIADDWAGIVESLKGDLATANDRLAAEKDARRDEESWWKEERDGLLPKLTQLQRERDQCLQALETANETNEALRLRNDSLERMMLHLEWTDEQKAILAAATADKETIWTHCHVVCWPSDGGYPLEHNPAANKDTRAIIEKELAARSAQPQTQGREES